ncbi:MAG TPA: hypothetical protein VGY91_01085 [Chthoniobacterales bacterium]|jgi:hypothetical protein|nr:hypothetical protein [Chthoniobacterales bacterium]
MEERGELPKQLSKRKKPGVRIAGLSETSILSHPGGPVLTLTWDFYNLSFSLSLLALK